MKTPEKILLDLLETSGVVHATIQKYPEFERSIVKAMEEYKNQFIDFDGPLAMVDHYQKLARWWEDAHAKLEEKLRIQYDAELEAFKVSFAIRTQGEFEEMINEAAHISATEITSLLKEIDRLRTRYNDMETRWMAAQVKYTNKLESDINDGKSASHREEDSPRNSGWSL